jgi:hypothetical protein
MGSAWFTGGSLQHLAEGSNLTSPSTASDTVGRSGALPQKQTFVELGSDNIVPRLVVNIEIVSWRSKQLLIDISVQNQLLQATRLGLRCARTSRAGH